MENTETKKTMEYQNTEEILGNQLLLLHRYSNGEYVKPELLIDYSHAMCELATTMKKVHIKY